MAEQLAFLPEGTGGTLIRFTEASGIQFQFKTGHSFYRPHRTPDGSNTDLRNTELTPDEIEAKIVTDIHLFLDSGGSLPILGQDFRQPMQREILVEGHRIAYRAVELPNGSISVGTYFAMS
ncbi:MAG: hypothetical protein DWI57_11775 [Chloroflexi bacterium]|nr:MAG: hypothetical protein DWI57_11775 [Chloroflexota bacterium]